MNTYTATEFLPVENPKYRFLKDKKEFKGSDNNTYYIDDSQNPVIIRAYTLEHGLKPIGYLVLSETTPGSNIYKADAGNNFAVFVEPEYRRKGIGSALYDYAEHLGYNIVPSDLQHAEAQSLWAKRKPELKEFISADEYPDFKDGQFNPLMRNRAYPPTMNMNTMPLSEEEISQEELNKKDLPYKYSNLFNDFVSEKTEKEIREIAPSLDLNQNKNRLIMNIEKNYPSLFDNFAEWLASKF